MKLRRAIAKSLLWGGGLLSVISVLSLAFISDGKDIYFSFLLFALHSNGMTSRSDQVITLGYMMVPPAAFLLGAVFYPYKQKITAGVMPAQEGVWPPPLSAPQPPGVTEK